MNKKGTLIVSLDFEVFWGMQDGHTLASYEANVKGGRKAIPRLLELFQEYGIHATWATVGFMFAESFDELKEYTPPKQLRPSYQNRKLSSYRCFSKIGENEAEAPCFYALSLIRRVSEIPGQEIASHTFSHYYCREEGQTPEQFKADIQAALAIANAHGYHLTSMVFPRNQSRPEYVDQIRELGFTAYREEEQDWIHTKVPVRKLMRVLRLADVYFPLTGQGGYVPENENGIVNLPGSRMYKPFFRHLWFLEKMKVLRIKKQMLHAAKHGLTFHLWWHPHNIGVRTEYHLKQLWEIFRYYDVLRQKYGMQSMNMKEAAETVRLSDQ